MKLDPFDIEVLACKDNAIDFMKRFYGVNLGQDMARKQKTGIQRHIKHKKRMEEQGDQSKIDHLYSHEDGSQTRIMLLRLSEEQRKDPNKVMDLMGYDPAKWECLANETTLNDWGVTMKLNQDGEDVPSYHVNHQYKVKLRIKPRQDLISSDSIRKVFENLKIPSIKPIQYQPGELMFELPMMDVHLMKRSDAEETGEAYDLQTASDLYHRKVLDIHSKLLAIKGLTFEKVLLPLGQDFFHYDNIDRKTTAGTPMDNDGPFYKMYEAGMDLMIWTVELFRKLAPIDILWVPGNHDWTLSYFAVSGLARIYQECAGVKVNIEPTSRKYVLFGKNLIGFSHGREEGKRIQTLMQQEAPEAWGDSQIREFHLGDLHHEEADEAGGIIFRRISSITAPDSWHVTKGYRATRKAEGYVWDKEAGRIYTICSYV